MRRFLLASCLSPCILLVAEAASAQTSVSTSTTAPLKTSAAGDISVTSAGSIAPAASGAAITLDSDNSVTNAGTLSFTDIDGATGIAAATGHAGSITNSGTITVTETDASADTDDDGDDDTPFATGSGRYGIHVTGGGTFTGALADSGTITVTGNDSAGIAIDGTLAGTLTSSGTITVVGSNDYGVRAQAVTGDVTLSGTIGVTGENATGVSLEGDVGGAVTIAGTVTATGFRTTSSSDTSTLDADDLLIGGPAVYIGANVAGGVLVAADDDLGTGSVISYGSAPGLLIGSSTADITIGLVADRDAALVIDGTVYGSGIFDGVSATAIQVGGTGGAVTLAGGIENDGTITGTSGTGVTTSYGILVGAGALVPSIVNHGGIYAYSAGSGGTVTAVKDVTGTLTSFTNTGTITASIATGYVAGQSIALDLSANTSGITFTQSLSDVEDATTPAIVGDILTGAGDDLLTITSGTITGNVSLGAGTNTVAFDTAHLTGAIDFSGGAGLLSLSGTGGVTGDVTFGAAGGRMVLADTAVFTGAIVQNGGALSLDVSGGSFAATNSGSINLSDLNIGATASVTVNIDAATGAHTLYQVSGAATIASGASVSLTLNNFISAETQYRILTAGTLTGGTGLTLDATALPYVFTASLSADDTAGTVDLDLRRKTAGELGFNRAEAAAYDAVYAAIPTDANVAQIMLGISDAATFNRTYSMFLPDYGGGAFLSAMSASRAVGAMATDPGTPRMTSGHLGMWLGTVGGYQHKGAGQASAYSSSHFGIAGGIEYRFGGLGTFGISVASIYNAIDDASNYNETVGYQDEIGGYWHGEWGGLQMNARAAVSMIDFSSVRYFLGYLNSSLIQKTAKADWSGRMVSYGGGLGYEAGIGKFSLRPNASIDYYRLVEDGHAETGGGSALDLAIGKRTSDQLAVAFGLTAGMKVAGTEDFSIRAEVEAGERKILRGTIGSTTANFDGGESFTLVPDALTDGPLAKLRLSGGSDLLSVSGELRAEEMQSDLSMGLRLGLKLKL